ncbi:ADP-ribosylglycohydrolase family protein [Bifidobacterium scardovii]|uniref:ADP-ribosylglycohydrolase family protein n=1 Tax=Bifidobacterium scardovii TaxID=158787 RepID=UPI0024203D06|nr:ADP-ribosylglycohydrolase family protein [Bifidobacterium scardovii]
MTMDKTFAGHDPALLRRGADSSNSVQGDIPRRIRGMLIGCAYGDAMGMPTEFIPRERMRECFPDGMTTFRPSTRYGMYPRSLAAGEVTDDTINTILIARMLIAARGHVDAHAYVEHLLDWIRRNPEKNDVVSGPSTRRALDAIQRGVPFDRAGIGGTTNGSSMKISPIGAISSVNDLSALVRRVEQICLPTHNTSIAIAGASAVAACVAYGIEGGADTGELWRVADRAARLGSERGYRTPTVDLCARLDAVYAAVHGVDGQEALRLLRDVFGTGVDTAETIPAVLVCVQLAGGDPTVATRMTAMLGGDTDTIGAIAGAICGAMHPERFPAEDVGLLSSVNGIDFDDLAEGLAEARTEAASVLPVPSPRNVVVAH